MPGGDGMGPQGDGPRTGRGTGQGGGQGGGGGGQGRGMGRGMGRGRRNQFLATGKTARQEELEQQAAEASQESAAAAERIVPTESEPPESGEGEGKAVRCG